MAVETRPEASITERKGGLLEVRTPYHPEAAKALKALMGKWEPASKTWLVREEHRDKVQVLIDRLWPSEDLRVERVVVFDTKGELTYQDPILDGLRLCNFERDRVGAVTHPNVIEVLGRSVKSGGSRANPKMGGRLVVRARIRPEAMATWLCGGIECAEIKEPDDHDAINPEAIARLERAVGLLKDGQKLPALEAIGAALSLLTMTGGSVS